MNCKYVRMARVDKVPGRRLQLIGASPFFNIVNDLAFVTSYDLFVKTAAVYKISKLNSQLILIR